MHLLTIPNILTSLRIFGAASLYFITPFTDIFFVVYTLCGISDVLDGVIARAFHIESEFGSKLDSAADLLFYLAMIIRIFPTLWEHLPKMIWLFVLLILLIRAAAYITAAVKYHRFASLHTYLNKLTGLCVFLIPYFIMSDIGRSYCFIACFVGMVASAEELIIHLIRKEYRPGVMSLIDLERQKKKTV